MFEGFFSVIHPTVDSETAGNIEGAFVMPVGDMVASNFPKNGGWILTQELRDIFEGSPLFSLFLMYKDKVFLITWNISAHSSLFCCQKER